jgi:Arc-like DNA binding domain
MAQRDEAAKAQLKVRCPEPLRARLEAEAARHGHSLNAEIVLQLQSALNHRELGQTIFGDENIFATVNLISYVIRGCEKLGGKKLREDFENILRKSVDVVILFMRTYESDKESGVSFRDLIDSAVSVLLQLDVIIQKEGIETQSSSKKKAGR